MTKLPSMHMVRFIENVSETRAEILAQVVLQSERRDGPDYQVDKRGQEATLLAAMLRHRGYTV